MGAGWAILGLGLGSVAASRLISAQKVKGVPMTVTTTDQGQEAASGSRAAVLAALQQLRAQRDEAFQELARLTEQECRYPATWGNAQRSVNFLLRAYALHEIDHLQHTQRLLRSRGYQLGEAQLILMKAQALRGELEAILLGLADEEFEAPGPEEGDWSIRQLVEHLQATDRAYLESVRKGLAAGRGEGAGAGA